MPDDTSDMIFDVPKLIEYCSAFTPLSPKIGTLRNSIVDEKA